MSDTTSMDMSLNESSDGVDMTRTATVLSREHVYQGAIFGVEDMRIALQTRDGGQTVIRRQVMRHAPCVVMLVHDCAQDLYLVEREYRVGCDAFAYGLPAGLIDDGEDVDAAALREFQFPILTLLELFLSRRKQLRYRPCRAILFIRRHDRRTGQHHGDAPAPLAGRRTAFRRRRACRICLDPVEAATRHAHHGLQFGDRHFA